MLPSRTPLVVSYAFLLCLPLFCLFPPKFLTLKLAQIDPPCFKRSAIARPGTTNPKPKSPSSSSPTLISPLLHYGSSSSKATPISTTSTSTPTPPPHSYPLVESSPTDPSLPYTLNRPSASPIEALSRSSPVSPIWRSDMWLEGKRRCCRRSRSGSSGRFTVLCVDTATRDDGGEREKIVEEIQPTVLQQTHLLPGGALLSYILVYGRSLGCTHYTLTRVNWTGNLDGHPHLYGPDEVSPELIYELRISNSTYSFMFARKFSVDSLEPLIQIAKPVIFSD
ncbi:hypothetical protein CK203_029599 [Vitis vinifera]|uniref:Uncharacterized protein n=1 Tax=Vitis vinifera TaxID=29760 RepID=A0A438JCC8_VITVI|nr:hypothetical protein CK203_029599 [Vitis vinifera]